MGAEGDAGVKTGVKAGFEARLEAVAEANGRRSLQVTFVTLQPSTRPAMWRAWW